MKRRITALIMAMGLAFGGTLLAGCADKAPSIKSLEINGQGELLVIMTDGTVTNLGKVKGEDGSDGADGQNGAGIASVYVNGDGVLVFNFTDGTSKEAGKVVGNDGVGVKSAYIDSNSNLIIVLSDGQTINCGNAGSGTPSQADENFYFAEAEKNGETAGYIVRDLGSISYPDIIVPSHYRDKPVVSVGENAFFNCKYITSVTLPDTVEAIDYCAFWGCTRLKSVTVGNGLKRIGDSAFNENTALESISLPASLESIGESAFAGCTALTSITLSEGLKSIGVSAFTGCGLESFVMPDSVETLGFGLFMNTPSLKEVKLSANLTELPSHTFTGCHGIQGIEIGNNVKTIKYSALFDMAMLEYVVLPAGLETIEPYGISKVGFPVDGGTPEKPVSVYRIDVFYKGDEDGWDAVDKGERKDAEGNVTQTNALGDVYFYSAERPSAEGNYWHYADGKPVKW